MILEDLHWIDSASEELVRKIVNSEVKLRLLLLISRRTDYMPHWLDQPIAWFCTRSPHAGDHPPPDALKHANQQFRRIDFGQMPVVEFERPQELCHATKWL
jgi:predicted ATPase